MSRTLSEVIAELQEKIGVLENEANGLKRKVNDLCVLDGMPEAYPDLAPDSASAAKSRTVRLRPDEFTADKMMKAMRRYLEMRKAANPDNAPAKIEEIRAALQAGGYDFKGKDPLSAVSISLGKSSHTFRRLNEGSFGLAVWYGGSRPSRPKQANSGAAAVTTTEDEDEDESPDADAEPVTVKRETLDETGGEA